jgi:hypothetical protein
MQIRFSHVIMLSALLNSGQAIAQDLDLNVDNQIQKILLVPRAVQIERHLGIMVEPQYSKLQFKTFMKTTIDELERVCDLTKTQKRKLTIAGKGAIERTLQKSAVAQNKFLNGVGREVIIVASPQASSLIKQSIWTKTLDKVLSKDQKAKLKKFRAEQKKKSLLTPYRTYGGII